MKKMINAAMCDAREVTEESLSGFESITVNAALLIVNERARELLGRYPVAINVSSTIEVPSGKDISVRTVNGSHEICEGADGSGVFLIVNGKLTAESGSLEAAKSYYRIMVNGKALLPRSFKGRLDNITANGKMEYYPDGAVILKANTEIDALFIARAANKLYHCPGTLYMLSDALDIDRLAEKGIRFSAKKLVAAEGLFEKLIPLTDEETELVSVPNGARLVTGDLELEKKTIKKHGGRLIVCGDVSIMDADALCGLEYLFATGNVRLAKNLEEAFDGIKSVYDELELIDPDAGYIFDRPSVKLGPAMLKKHPNGLYVSDCASVCISPELDADTIMEKLHISDCAHVLCTKEQEEAVSMIASGVASISTGDGADGEEGIGSMLKSVIGSNIDKDTLMINAADYKM